MDDETTPVLGRQIRRDRYGGKVCGVSGRTRRGVLACFGGFIIELTLGSVYSFGNITTYVTSYLRNRVDPTVTYADTAWIPSIMMACGGVFVCVGGVLHKWCGARVASSIGCAFTSFSVTLTYWSIQHSCTLTIVTYGFCAGIGISMGYVPLLFAGPRWFLSKTGLAVGMVMSGYGLSAIIFNQVQTSFINPDNLSLDDDGYFSDSDLLDRVPRVFLLLGSIFAVMQLIGLVLTLDPPEETMEEKLAREHKEKTRRGATRVPVRSVNWLQMLRTREFYYLFVTLGLINIVVNFFMSSYKTFGQTFISNDKFLSVIGSAASACNASGKILWGFIYDKSSFKFAMMAVTGLLAVLTGTLCLAPRVANGGVFFAVWIFLIYFSFSGTYSIAPSIVTHAFGPEYSSINYGIINTQKVVAGVLAGFVTNTIAEVLGWTAQMLSMSLLAGAGFVLVCLYPGEFIAPNAFRRCCK